MTRGVLLALLALGAFSAVSATVIFKETFEDGERCSRSWRSRRSKLPAHHDQSPCPGFPVPALQSPALCISSGSAVATAADWEKRWTVSSWKKSDGTAGDWVWTAGDWWVWPLLPTLPSSLSKCHHVPCWGPCAHAKRSWPILPPRCRYGDAEADKGIKTTPDARFFAISSELKEPFTNKDAPLVLQVGRRLCRTVGT
jgi:hypothetical protein